MLTPVALSLSATHAFSSALPLSTCSRLSPHVVDLVLMSVTAAAARSRYCPRPCPRAALRMVTSPR